LLLTIALTHTQRRRAFAWDCGAGLSVSALFSTVFSNISGNFGDLFSPEKSKSSLSKGFFLAPSERNEFVFFDFLKKNQKKQTHFSPPPLF
jgi:hypothetical protein